MQETMLDRRHTTLMLSVVFFATFMDGLDGSIVGIALPDIGDSFGVDTATSSWVSIIYMMILAGTLVMFARIASDTGVRKVMATGLAVFTVGSLFCGLSTSFGMLIASRAVQAVGAAMMAAAGPMCCTEHLPASRLAFGLSVVTIGSSLGFAVGPALGGIIVEYVSWHWIFLINLPLGLIAAPLMLKAIPKSSEKRGRSRLDILGVVLLFSAVALGTFAVETMSYSNMRNWSALTGVACVALLAAFVRWERSREEPLLRLHMFARWDFSAIFLCLMLLNMSFMGMLYLIPFFGRICTDMSSLEVGLFLLEASAVTAVFGLPIAKWSDRKGRRMFCVTAGLMTALAFFLFAVFADNMTYLIFFAIMIPQGLGWAFTGGPMASRLVEHAGEDRDMASSLTNEAYFIGGTIGIALAAMVFTTFSRSNGIDISAVSPAAFIDGFVPTAIMCATFAVILSAISYIVKDEKKG